ncbi:MAG: trimethylamine methyltransferase family protein [Alphaproteobacteria bacterium]
MENNRRRSRRSGGASEGAKSKGFNWGNEHLHQPNGMKYKIPQYQFLNDEQLQKIEDMADTILQEIGIEFRGHPSALELWKNAGADVNGELVKMPKGMARKIIQDTTPETFTWHARDEAKSVQIGGDVMAFSVMAGAPFVRDQKGGRRYGTIADYQNIVKIAQSCPWMHHIGFLPLEPTDITVNHRHLDMYYTSLAYSDKASGTITTGDFKAEDAINMAKIAYGDVLNDKVVTGGNINVNSPLVIDDTMLSSAEVYAKNKQPVVVTPFILTGAMGPTTVAGAIAQVLAEAMAGLAWLQLVNPGTPGIMGTFTSSMSLRTGAPTFGMPEPALGYIAMGQLAKRLRVPLRGGGSLSSSPIADYQAGQESADTLMPTMLGQYNLGVQSVGWLEGGLSFGYEKMILDLDHLGMMHKFTKGWELDHNDLGFDALSENGPGHHCLGTAHTMANYKTAMYDPVASFSGSVEQWEEEGSLTSIERAGKVLEKILEQYEQPVLEQSVDEELKEYIAKRKTEIPATAA